MNSSASRPTPGVPAAAALPPKTDSELEDNLGKSDSDSALEDNLGDSDSETESEASDSNNRDKAEVYAAYVNNFYDISVKDQQRNFQLSLQRARTEPQLAPKKSVTTKTRHLPLSPLKKNLSRNLSRKATPPEVEKFLIHQPLGHLQVMEA